MRHLSLGIRRQEDKAIPEAFPELLAGIPSVVYGFLGVVYIVPIIREHLGGAGFSILSTSLVLGIMILPTITSISFDSLMSVPPAFREGSLAMGATKWQTISRVVLPAARSGILASFILGMGRAVGETMAVIMVAGNEHDARSFARFAQKLLQDVVMALRPIGSTTDLPEIDDIPDEI